MKVCLAALISLFACFLVLPTVASGRRRLRKEQERDEYEVSHLRKRRVQITQFFSSDNLPKACSVCHALYHITEANCAASKRKAKYKCFLKAKNNRDAFASKFQESGSQNSKPAESAPSSGGGGEGAPGAESAPSSGRGGDGAPGAESAPSSGGGGEGAPGAKSAPSGGGGEVAPGAEAAPSGGGGEGVPGAEGAPTTPFNIDGMYVIDLSRPKEKVFSPLPTSKEDAFGPKNVETSCKVCRQMANVNLIECMKPEENHENKCCKFIYDTMKDAFELEWRNAPERYRVIRTRKRKFRV